MLPLLRGVSGRLRRSLSTAASRPPWVMMDKSTQLTTSPVAVSSSFAPPPSASRVTIPVWSLDLEPPGPGEDDSEYMYYTTMSSCLLAASAHGFLLLDTHKSREKLDPFEVLYRRFECRVCNPVTGELFRLPDFHGADETSTGGMGLLTIQPADGPPKRYAAAQLTEVDDDGRRFMLRRFSSETGVWDEMVLPSPLPPGRRMQMNHTHEVLDFGGRLWWVDVSWGAVCVDPFSDRPELRAVELPAGRMLPFEHCEAETRQRLKRRRMGVSAGRLRYVEVDYPSDIRSFTLDDESGSWTLEHEVSFANLWPNAPMPPSIAAIDLLNADVLHLKVFYFNVSVDMCQNRIIESTQSTLLSKFLPCVLPSFLGSSPIPGKNDVEKNKTLADVLVRSDRHPET